MYETIGYVQAWVGELTCRRRRAGAGQRGQGTVEYVGLVTLIAVVMFGVIAAMKSYKMTEGQQLALLLVKKIEEAVKQVRY